LASATITGYKRTPAAGANEVLTTMSHPAETNEQPLGSAARGFSGVIRRLAVGNANSALSDHELESRLIELGFVEGARVELLHQGIVGRDPIAVRVDNITIALRRREAMAIIVA
jgi:ferrous iron transport protein A